MANSGSNPFDEVGQARKRLTIAAAAAALLVLLLWLGNVGTGTDLRLLDSWFSVRGPRDPSPQVVIVAIDEKSINTLGPFPWPRDQYAPVVRKLHEMGARVIGFDVTFGPNPRENEPGPPIPAPGSDASSPDGAATVPGPSHNQIFAQAISDAGNVVFGFEFDNLEDSSPPGSEPAPYLVRNAVPRFDWARMSITPAPVVVTPEAMLIEAAAAVGFVNAMPEQDGTVRSYPMLIKHGDRFYPSLGLQTARVYMQESIDKISVKNNTVTVGFADIPVTNNGRLMIDWTSTEPSFPTFSVTEVLRGEVNEQDVKDKAVLIAATAKGLDDRNLPFVKSAPGVLLHATVLDNIFKLQFFRWPTWSWLLAQALVPLLLLVGVLLYPRLKTLHLLLVAPALVVFFLGLSLALFLIGPIWFKPFYPCLAALLPLLPVVGIKLRETEQVSRDIGAEKLETDKLLGLSFQEKGMLDMALATFNKLQLTDDLKHIYINLGLDFENRGQKEKAFLAYKRVFDADPRFEDVASRIEGLRQQGVGTRVFATGTLEMGAAGAAASRADSADSTQALSATAGSPTLGGATSSSPTGLPTAAHLGTSGATVAPAGRTSAAIGASDHTVGLGGPRGALIPGARFGRYEIDKKLGKGAMGEVYKVRDPKIGRIAAMKTIRVDMDLTPQQMIELRQRFYREAQTAGKLTHPNIVTIYDVGEEEGVSFIVMEFVEGDTLTNLVKKFKGRLSVPQIKHVIVNAAAGLDYAHQNGVIHRDVKPDNIMVSPQGLVKVMDFGIARIVESDMTRTGSVLGTPAYMSPEQFSGRKVDGRADIFSLGVVLYELVAHKRPFRGDTPTAVMFEILQRDPEPPSAIDSTANAVWDPIVMKALNKNPDLRYASAQEFAAAVRAAPVK